MTVSQGQSAGSTPRRTMRRRAYDLIKDAILNGQLKRGERVSDARLMQEFDVGRTPLREALNQLEREGLVVSQPHTGYTVANLDTAAVLDLMMVREGLDALAIELAIAKGDDDDFEPLKAIMVEIEDLDQNHPQTPESYARELDLGLRVHQIILEIADNPPLMDVSEQIYAQLRLALWAEVRWIEQWKQAVEEHREIISAVLERDTSRAVEAARAHIRSSRDSMAMIEQINDYRWRDGQRLAMKTSLDRKPRDA